jgi:release factor glutamine methyltransferase
MDIYEPAEDSFLLQKHVRQFAQGRVLDMGTGSGIQAIEAMKSPAVREVIAVDINPIAIEKLDAIIDEKKLRKIKPILSDLFENVTGSFNLIIFNPPYLPQDKGVEDYALYGGKKGWEISERFFNGVAKYLSAQGSILFLFSTLTNKEKIEEIISLSLFEFKLIDSLKISFEELYVYQVTKSDILKALETQHLENITYFAKGKRGYIYRARQDQMNLIKSHITTSQKIDVAIKLNNPNSQAIGRIENEANWLKTLNKVNIGPGLIFSHQDFFTYSFVEGEPIMDCIKSHSKTEIISVLKQVLDQCISLDKLGVTKEEMHHPQKHILVDVNNQVTLIDFERCHHDQNPQNVTQYLEFISRIKDELAQKEIGVNPVTLRDLAKKYKDTYDSNILKGIFQN